MGRRFEDLLRPPQRVADLLREDVGDQAHEGVASPPAPDEPEGDPFTGLVTQERQATTLICRANYPAMNGLIGFLADECCADAGCSTRAENAA